MNKVFYHLSSQIAVMQTFPSFQGFTTTSSGSISIKKNALASLKLGFLTLLLTLSAFSVLFGQAGAALDFDGVNDRVDIADAAWNDFGSGDFTVECWVKKQAGSSGWSNVTAVGKWNTGGAPGTNEWLIALTGDGNNELPNFSVEVGSMSYVVTATTPMVVGTWYHIAGVRQGTSLRIYVNGVLEGTTTNVGITNINNIVAREIMLGKLDGFGGHTNMEMDELRIWGTARTGAEILANKNCEIPTTGTNLLANYHFNQGTADANNAGVTSLTDVAGSSRNGTLFNFALSGVSVSNWTAPGGVVNGSSCLPVHNVTQNTYFSTIQAAINVAAANDVIECSPGTYNEAVTIDKSLTVQGTNSNRALQVLDGTGITAGSNGFTINSNITGVTIKNFTVQNFTGTSGNSAGIKGLLSNSNLLINNVDVKNNANSAGIHLSGGSAIDNVTITNSSSSNHGPGVRGIVIWDGLKTNINISNNTVTNNNCCGIELQDGNASAVTVSGNTIDIGAGDNGLGLTGMNSSIGANLIQNNTITGGGRFGIEIKNPAGGVTVSGNTVTLSTLNSDQKDKAGIAVFRRAKTAGNVDVPNGVTVTGNTVVGYTQASTSEGFGVVIEGTNHTVTGNTVNNCEVGILQQQNPSNYPGDADQSDLADQYFGRGNSPQTCGNTISGNTFSSNGVDTRNIGVGAGIVTNTNTSEIFCSIQSAINNVQTLNGHTLEVNPGTYDEQVLVNKELTIKSATSTKAIINFTGTPSGKPTLFDVSANNVTIENLQFDVDLSKLRSAIIASAVNLDAITVKDNLISAYGTPAGSYGDRNAVSVNYGGTTNYRVAAGGVNTVSFTGNTVTGTGPTSYYRSGIALDEGGLTATGNTLTTINHDVLLRFASNGANLISSNNLNGGGIELADQNAGSGLITVSGNTFTGAGAPGTAKLRVKNGEFNIAHVISTNTFNTFDWGVSLENMRSVTLSGNTFNGDAATDRHVVVNTKSISSNSNSITQVPVDAVMTGNAFAGQGIGLTFQNHDSDNDSYGTFTIGSAGNANTFAAGLSTFIQLDAQTGSSNGSTFPTYPVTGGWPTTMDCWAINLDIQNNTFDVGAGQQAPQSMSASERAALEGKLTHKPDVSCLGNLQYFLPVHNLTQNTYFGTIQPAIVAANPNDVIELAEGTYNEAVAITKALTLQGVDSDKTKQVINGTGLGITSGITISNAVTNVTIKNLTVQNFTGATGNANAGIYAIGGNNNLTVTNVALLNNPTASGFYANGPVDNVSVTNSMVVNNGGGARGIVIWNGLKTNITLTGNMLTNNSCCGIELQDGDASAVTVSGNTIDIDGGDNAIGIVGLNNSVGNNLIQNNTITGGGRYGIEIKNPANGVTVSGNTVTLATQNGDVRDRAGIAVFRRGVMPGNVDVPNGVTISGNTIDGYSQSSTSEGFGIVIEGTNHSVTGNMVKNCEVGILQQQNPSNYPGDANQNDVADQFFGRGNSPQTCGNTITGNTFTSNGLDQRTVPMSILSGGSVINTRTGSTFCTIQSAIAAATTLAGDTLQVSAGLYAENIVVNKSLTILGPNANVDPCSGTRGAEAVVTTAVQDWTNGAVVFYIAANTNNVKISGFTIDGDNTALTSGVIGTNGADIDAAEAVSTYETGVNGLTVTNNIIQNFAYFGVTLYDYPAGVASSGHKIAFNKIQNMGTYLASGPAAWTNYWGGGALLYNNQYAEVSNNCMTNVRLGVQTGNYYQANPGSSSSQVLSNNTISSRRVGVFHNLHYSSASPFTFANNTFTTIDNSNETGWRGILLGSLSVASTVNNNTISGAGSTRTTVEGVNVWNCQTASSITGGTISDVKLGINVNNYEGYASDANNTTALIDGVTITAASVAGVLVNDNALNTNGATVSAEVTNSTISGSPAAVGILISGADASGNIHDNDATISGQLIGIDVNGGNATINNNYIYDNGIGVRFTNAGNGTVHTNKFQGATSNGTDLQATSDAGAVIATPNNWFAGTTFGVENLSGANIAATLNYWNAANGPGPVGMGAGANVSTNVTYCPILSDAPVAFGGAGTVVTGPSALTYATNPAVYIEGTSITPNTPTITGTAPFTYTVSSLPAGLSISPTTGEISGTPTAPTVLHTYTVTATNACGSTSAVVTITITALPFAGGPCALLDEDFSTNPQLSNVDVNGAWYPDRYRPASFTSNGTQLKISIQSVDGAQLRPSSYNAQFYNTQGRKINQCGGCVTVLKAELFIPTDWATKHRRSDIWGTAFDATNVDHYPIIGFANIDGGSPTFRYWDEAIGWVNVTTTINYDAWTQFEASIVGGDFVYKINGNVVGIVDAGGSIYIGNVIMQAYNFNDNTLGAYYDPSPDNSYDALWDNLSTASASGNVVTNVNTGDTYCSIQSAVDAATAGDVLSASADTYSENVIVNKAIIIQGANFGTAGCSGSRVTESVVNGGSGAAFTITANGVTIDGFEILGATGVASTASTNLGIRNNKMTVAAVGVNASGVATTIGNTLTVEDNCIDLLTQTVAGPTATIGVLVNGATGTAAVLIDENKITDAFYGVVLNGVNTTPASIINKDTIAGVMQGVAIVNTIGGPLAPSNVAITAANMSGFAGAYPALPAQNFHAGVYTFTAGPTTPATGITLAISNTVIDGTQTVTQASGGVYLADFSTGTVPVQTVSIDECEIKNNTNRGVDARGRVNATITESTFTNNGGAAFGSGGNDGYTIIAQQGADVTATNNFITHPATSTTPVTALLTGNTPGAAPNNVINATNNSILMNGNPQGFGANNTSGNTLNATCNWWGVTCSNIVPLISGVVTYEPYLTSGVDDLPVAGFQPVAGTCTGSSTLTAAIAGTPTICEPGTVTTTLTGSAAGGLAPYTTHLWSSGTPANVTVSPTNAAITAAIGVAQGTSLLTYIVTDSNGCTDSETVTVTVTNASAAPVVVCKVGTGLDFDGVNEYVTVADNAALEGMGALTVMGWIKMDALPVQNYAPIAKENAYRMIIGNDGSYHFVVATGSNGWYSPGTVASGGANVLPINQWVHMAGVYNGSDVKIYVNGVLQGTATPNIAGNIVNNGSAFTIAHKTSSNIDYFNGKMDEVAVFNQALTATQIENYLANSLTGSESGLVASYNLEEGTGTVANDLAGSAQNGTLVNMENVDWIRTPFGPTGSITVAAVPSTCISAAQTFDVLAFDNCGVASLTNDYNNSGSANGTYPVGSTIVTWTAADASGNMTTCAFTVVVTESEAPMATAPTAIAIACGASAPVGATTYAGFILLGGTASDNCTANDSLLVAYTDGALSGNSCGGSIARMYTVTDQSGNTTTVTQTITVNPAPVAAFAAVSAITVACGSAVPSPLGYTNGLGGACEISGTVTSTLSAQVPAGQCGGTITESWTYTDGCGRTITQSRAITVNPAPVAVFAAVSAITVACGSAVPSPLGYTNGLTGTCEISGTVTSTLSAQVPAGQCGGTITESWTYTDGCGRTIAQSRAITVNPAPVAAFAAVSAITVACGSAVPSPLGYTNGLTGTCEISGTVTSTLSAQVPAGQCGGTITESWTYTDGCGRTITQSRAITVNPAPVAAFAAVSAITVACGSAVPSPLGYTNGLTGTCEISGTVTSTLSAQVPAGQCGGTITESWTYTDGCGRTITQSRAITVNPAPVAAFAAVSAITVACGSAVPSPLGYTNGLTGTCEISGTVTSTLSAQVPAGQCGGTITESWTYTDGCGRTITQSRAITVNPAPVAAFAAVSAITVACGSAVPSPLGYTNGLTGTCEISGTVTSTLSAQVPAGQCGGTITESWTYTDGCGRTITQSRAITVSPTPVAAFAAVSAITVACGSAVPSPLGYTNGLGGACEISGTVTSTLSAQVPAGQCGGTITESWTYTDGCGRTITQSRAITVSPTPVAAFAAVSAITVACGSAVPSPLGYTNGLGGACEISGTVTSTLSAQVPAGQCGGTITESWTYTDGCGRTITQTRAITVSPAALPTMPAQNPITVSCTPVPTPSTISFSNGLGAGCLISGTSNPSTFSTNSTSTCSTSLTETWTAQDACGRTIASVSRIVTVVDDVAPTALCKNVTVLLNGSGNGGTNAAAINNNSVDNCSGIQSYSLSKMSFNCTNVGPNTVILSVTDNCQNVGTCSAIVTVSYNQPPVAKCRNAVVMLSAAGNGSITTAGINNNSTDVCSGNGLTLSLSKSTFNCSNLGPNIVTLTVTNSAMVSSTCTGTVTVRDGIKPVARCISNVSFTVAPGGTIVVPPSAINNGSTDACSTPPILTLSPNTFVCGATAVYPVTLTAKDGSNNAGTCNATVTITCSGSAPSKGETAEAFADYTELMDLFPNPAADQVILRLSRAAVEDHIVSVLDYTGKLMFTKVIAKGDLQLTVDLLTEKLQSGIYMVSVRFSEGVQTKQLVVFKD